MKKLQTQKKLSAAKLTSCRRPKLQNDKFNSCTWLIACDCQNCAKHEYFSNLKLAINCPQFFTVKRQQQQQQQQRKPRKFFLPIVSYCFHCLRCPSASKTIQRLASGISDKNGDSNSDVILYIRTKITVSRSCVAPYTAPVAHAPCAGALQ